MSSRGTARAGLCLTVALLLWAACDVLENKKFPPPSGPPVYDPGYYTGVGGYGYAGYGYAGYGYAGSGYGGYGGYGGRARPDGGVLGLGGAGMSCGPLGDACVSTCYSDMPVTSAPICDPSRGTWICAGGMVLRSSCPAGSCANTFLYCCDTVTGARVPAGCTQGGFRGLCPANYHSLTPSDCIPDGLGVSACAQLYQQACSVPDQQCHSGGLDCICQPGGDGGHVWMCLALI